MWLVSKAGQITYYTAASDEYCQILTEEASKRNIVEPALARLDLMSRAFLHVSNVTTRSELDACIYHLSNGAKISTL